jgi:diguanylate cyclase (GGDEF)-like protein/PAS domain S-box-containing protein
MVSSIVQKTPTDTLRDIQDFDLSKAVMNACLDPIFILDSSGQILFSNAAAGRIFGYNNSELPGHNFGMFLADDEFESYKAFVSHCRAAGDNPQGQYIHLVGSDRQKVKVIASVGEYAAPGSAQDFIIVAAKDLSEELKLRKQKNELEHHYTEMLFAQSHYEEQAAQVVNMAEELAMEKDKVEESKRMIEFQACHDPLTGLGNRILMHKAFPDLLTKAKACVAGVGFIYIDLDNFKTVNDRLGHNAGDKLLCDVGDKIKQNIGEHDIAIRLGGDEFAVIVYLESDDETKLVYAKAEKLLTDLDFALKDEFSEIKVTASIGVALYPRDGHTLDMLLTHADTSMYDAKKSGKAKVL